MVIGRACRLRTICLVAMTFVGVCAPDVSQAQTLKLAWDPNPEPNIASYAVYVSTSPGGYTVPLQLVPAGQTTFEYAPPRLGHYYFVVTAINTDGLQSSFSNEVSGIITGFTNDPLIPGVDVMRAIHIQELRKRIDLLRSREGLSTGSWVGSTPPTGAIIRAADVNEMRTKLAEVYQRRQRPLPTYTDQIVAGTLIKAVHIVELRAAVVALE